MLGCLERAVKLLSVNGGRFEINQLLFTVDTALMTASEEKLYIQMREFGRVCERRKLGVNVGKSKVMSAQGMEMEVECL